MKYFIKGMEVGRQGGRSLSRNCRLINSLASVLKILWRHLACYFVSFAWPDLNKEELEEIKAKEINQIEKPNWPRGDLNPRRTCILQFFQ